MKHLREVPSQNGPVETCSRPKSQAVSLGQKACEAAGFEPATVFAQQFRISRSNLAPLIGFRRLTAGPLEVEIGPDLPVATCEADPADTHIVFLGIGVDADGDLVTSETLSRKASRLATPEDAGRYVCACAGRYVALVSSAGGHRLYLDPIGSLGAVYDPRTGVVASTLNLALDRDPEPNRSYSLAAPASKGMGRFAFGHTADEHVRRVLPNHFLDLDNFTLTRHWPGEDDLVEPDQAQQRVLLRRIWRRFGQVTATLAGHDGQVLLPVSGGIDSRLLLAACRPVLDRMDIFSHVENAMSRRDTRIAAALVQSMGQSMRVIDPLRDDTLQIKSPGELEALERQWQIATGAAPISKAMHKVVQAQSRGGILLRGNVVDFLKAVLWRRGVREYEHSRPHSVKLGLRMMMLGDKTVVRDPDLQREYSDWYAGLSGIAASRPYDLMFAEQFLSHGLGNMLYGFTRNFYVCPFNDRALLGMATSLPPDRRFRLDYTQALVARWAPELYDMHYARQAVNIHLKEQRTAGMTPFQIG